MWFCAICNLDATDYLLGNVIGKSQSFFTSSSKIMAKTEKRYGCVKEQTKQPLH